MSSPTHTSLWTARSPHGAEGPRFQLLPCAQVLSLQNQFRLGVQMETQLQAVLSRLSGRIERKFAGGCLLYTSDAADDC